MGFGASFQGRGGGGVVLWWKLTNRPLSLRHTSVVVFGREYYYGQGIFIDHPGQTHHGAPLQEIPMGTTHIPEEVFVEFIAQMRQIWTGDRYHLLDNNCNNFSSEVCKFLVGKAIPSQIEGLPAEVMNTPFGAALRPMIEGMFGGSAVPSNNNNNSGYPLTSTFSSQPSNIPSCIISISNLQELQHRLKLHRLVAIDFTSTSCPPCRIISPEFERLVEERQIYNGKSSDLVGLKVDVGIGRDAASFFKVTATPTFMFYLDGVKTAEFKGAQVGELKSNLDLLLFTAYPPHPHCKISIPTLSSYPQVPIAFNASASLDKIFIKLDENCSQSGLPGLRDGIKEAVKEKSELPSNWHQEVIPLLKQLPLALIFPLIDVVRIMALSNNVVNFFQKETPSSMMAHLNRCVSEQKSLQKATALMSLRLVIE